LKTAGRSKREKQRDAKKAQTDRMSRVQINITLRGFVLNESIRLETCLVLCNMNLGHAAVRSAF